ncbi:hypothetical protein [Legionella hackeliae]|uniref:Uncharacterized protein n=1 Tax=Legionella hackeliae TaxID=449 RepID=A0A0A8UUR5_LEGHA|nr:hypothetical protein [Legionella hackeliae]KTD15387.1 hypothetical protein Lhac_0229 [Legionella hackeliae]CEK11246.1 protein of unknown function [Legionella hackeliae]STX48011.1 Uncharacterised protein [Legionella hackeliae]
MSFSFFTTAKNVFEQAFDLARYQEEKVTFDPKNPTHTKLLEDSTNLVTTKLKALHSIDSQIATSFTVGTFALGVSVLLAPFGTLAGICYAYGAYQLGQRKAAYAEYTSALENLARCCHWALGDVSNRDAKVIKENSAINNMMNTLYPLTNEAQLRLFISDNIENAYIEKSQEAKQDLSFMEHHLNQEEARLYFKIYGYKQGSFLDILQGIGFAIKNGFQAFGQLFSKKPVEEVSAPLNTM